MEEYSSGALLPHASNGARRALYQQHGQQEQGMIDIQDFQACERPSGCVSRAFHIRTRTCEGEMESKDVWFLWDEFSI